MSTVEKENSISHVTKYSSDTAFPIRSAKLSTSYMFESLKSGSVVQFGQNPAAGFKTVCGLLESIISKQVKLNPGTNPTSISTSCIFRLVS